MGPQAGGQKEFTVTYAWRGRGRVADPSVLSNQSEINSPVFEDTVITLPLTRFLLFCKVKTTQEPTLQGANLY